MIDMRIKDMFFDRPKVMNAVDRANRQSLSKAGAFVRQAARTSIRKRKGTSPAGSPPYSHEGSLRKWILFGYDAANESVVVGPVGFRKSEAPNVLEFGGTTTIYRRKGSRLIPKRVKIAARSFMAPALEKERPKLPALWRNSVRGS